MAEIVNLRRARKQRDRSLAEVRAKEMRARHGLTPGEREKQAREEVRTRQLLDGSFRDTPN